MPLISVNLTKFALVFHAHLHWNMKAVIIVGFNDVNFWKIMVIKIVHIKWGLTYSHQKFGSLNFLMFKEIFSTQYNSTNAT